MNARPWMLVLTLASSAAAQTPAINIRVTGQHTIAKGETSESARQFALVDAHWKASQQVATHLQDRAEVKALQLKSIPMAAYLTAVVELDESSTHVTLVQNRSVLQVEGTLLLDVDETVRRLAGLRKDQEASNALVDGWNEMQALHQHLADQAQRLARSTKEGSTGIAQEQQMTLAALRATRLAAQVTAALAKTEESPGGGRVPAKEGRERAKQLADAALALSPVVPVAHSAMGDVLVDARQLQAAEAEYRKALLGDSGSSSGHLKLATVLRLEGKLPDADAELREALRINPGSARAHSDLGLVLRAQRNVSDAISEYREALRLDPDLIEAHNGLAITFASQRRVPEGIAEFREIVRIDPDSTVGYYNLAVALADIDLDEESAAALREVVRINPNHYNAHYNLGELFRLEGKFDDSARQFRDYLRTPA